MRAYRLYMLAAMMTAATCAVNAQELNSAYFTEGYSYRHDMNPAIGNESNYIAVPIVGNLSMQLRGSLGVGDIFYKNPYYGMAGHENAKKTATLLHPAISASEALSNLDKGANTMLLNVDIPIVSVGFKGFNGYNTIEARTTSLTIWACRRGASWRWPSDTHGSSTTTGAWVAR